MIYKIIKATQLAEPRDIELGGDEPYVELDDENDGLDMRSSLVVSDRCNRQCQLRRNMRLNINLYKRYGPQRSR